MAQVSSARRAGGEAACAPTARAAWANREHPQAACTIPGMPLAAKPAFWVDIGLIVTFIGIGVVAGIIVVYIIAQAFGERTENQERKETV